MHLQAIWSRAAGRRDPPHKSPRAAADASFSPTAAGSRPPSPPPMHYEHHHPNRIQNHHGNQAAATLKLPPLSTDNPQLAVHGTEPAGAGSAASAPAGPGALPPGIPPPPASVPDMRMLLALTIRARDGESLLDAAVDVLNGGGDVSLLKPLVPGAQSLKSDSSTSETSSVPPSPIVGVAASTPPPPPPPPLCDAAGSPKEAGKSSTTNRSQHPHAHPLIHGAARLLGLTPRASRTPTPEPPSPAGDSSGRPLTPPAKALGGGGGGLSESELAAMEQAAAAERMSEFFVEEKHQRPVLYAYCRLLVSRWLHEARFSWTACASDDGAGNSLGQGQPPPSPASCRGQRPPSPPEPGVFTLSDARASRDYFLMNAALPWACPVEHHGVKSKHPLWIARAEDVPKLQANPLTDAVEVGLSLRGFMTAWFRHFHRTQPQLQLKTFSEDGPLGSILEWVFVATGDTNLVVSGLFAEVFPADFAGPTQNQKRAIIYAIESTEVRDAKVVWSVGKKDDTEDTHADAAPPYAPPRSQTPARALLVSYVDWLGVRYGPDFLAHLWVDPPAQGDPPLLFKGTSRTAFTSQPELYKWYQQLFSSYGFKTPTNEIALVAPRIVLPQFSSELDVKHSGYNDDPRFHQTGNFGAIADELQRKADAALLALRAEVAGVNDLLAKWTLLVQPRYGAVGVGKNVGATQRSRLRRPRAASAPSGAVAVERATPVARGAFGLAIDSAVAPILALPFPSDNHAVFAQSSAALLAATGEGDDCCA